MRKQKRNVRITTGMRTKKPIRNIRMLAAAMIIAAVCAVTGGLGNESAFTETAYAEPGKTIIKNGDYTFTEMGPIQVPLEGEKLSWPTTLEVELNDASAGVKAPITVNYAWHYKAGGKDFDQSSMEESGKRLNYTVKSGSWILYMFVESQDENYVFAPKTFKEDTKIKLCGLTFTVEYACESYITYRTEMVVPGDISNAEIGEPEELPVYTGKPCTPLFNVYAGTKALSEGADYTLSYKNNTNIGAATVIAEGSGKWYGKIQKKFRIYGDLSKAATKTSVAKIPDQVYTGKALTPKPTVKAIGRNGEIKTLKNGTDTAFLYRRNKNVGTATVTIMGDGWYTGEVTRTFKINPAGTRITAVTPGKKSFTVSWKKQTVQTTGYQIQYATNKTFTKNEKIITIKNNKKLSKMIKNLKARKKYFVRIRTWKKVNGANYFSKWSAVKTVKTK